MDEDEAIGFSEAYLDYTGVGGNGGDQADFNARGVAPAELKLHQPEMLKLFNEVNMFDASAPMNWFLRENNLDSNALWIKAQLEEKMEKMENLHKIAVLKKAAEGANISLIKPVGRRTYFESVGKDLLRYPPTDKSEWMGIAAGEHDDRRYIRMFSAEEMKKSVPMDNYSFEKEPKYKSFLKAYKDFHEAESQGGKQEKKVPSGSAEFVEGELTQTLSEKYGKIRKFADLISDHAGNRIALNWLHMWNHCVFKKKNFVAPDQVSWNERGLYDYEKTDLMRPNKKIMGIFGPVGCCKTTLAKTITALAGYNCIHISVSENIAVEELKVKIERALSNTSLSHFLGNRSDDTQNVAPKPNCIVLDDIDCASQEILNYLIKLTKQTGDKTLKRPIIVVGSKLFSMGFKELRNHMAAVKLNTPFQQTLENRLRYICIQEDFDVDKKYLSDLMSECYFDIRRCLNNLYLIFAGSKQHSFDTHIETSNDMPIFAIWDKIFLINRHFTREGQVCSLEQRHDNIENVINSSDYADRIVFGLFMNKHICPNDSPHANYLMMKQLTSIQYFQDSAQKNQHYSLIRYRNAMITGLHSLFAFRKASQGRRFKYDFNGPSFFKPSYETTMLFHTFALNPDNRDWSTMDYMNDLMPYLYWLINPAVKLMTITLLGDDDLRKIQTATNILKQLGINIKEANRTHETQNKALANHDEKSIYYDPDPRKLAFFIEDPMLKSRLSPTIKTMILQNMNILKVFALNQDKKEKEKAKYSYMSSDAMKEKVDGISGMFSNKFRFTWSQPVKKARVCFGDANEPLIYEYWNDDDDANDENEQSKLGEKMSPQMYHDRTILTGFF
uniref:ATPase_AAA_core domain-containing protein n=1 Tax=Rhabditophanes sp. KR3021 TaxID=114890 RepID=A0AC35TQV7_9BILA